MIEEFKIGKQIKKEESWEEIKRMREEFKQLIEGNLKRKEEGEEYDHQFEHFQGVDLNILGEEELLLWNKLKGADTLEALDSLDPDLNNYRERIREEVRKELAERGLEGDVFEKAFYNHPKQSFIGFFSNQLFRERILYIKKQIQK